MSEIEVELRRFLRMHTGALSAELMWMGRVDALLTSARAEGYEQAKEQAAVVGADAAAAYDERATGIDVHTGRRGVEFAAAIRTMEPTP